MFKITASSGGNFPKLVLKKKLVQDLKKENQNETTVMAKPVFLYRRKTLKYVNLSSPLTDVITMVLSVPSVSRTNDHSRLYTIQGVLSLQQTVVPKIIFIAFQNVINLINKYLPGWKIPSRFVVSVRAILYQPLLIKTLKITYFYSAQPHLSGKYVKHLIFTFTTLLGSFDTPSAASGYL